MLRVSPVLKVLLGRRELPERRVHKGRREQLVPEPKERWGLRVQRVLRVLLELQVHRALKVSLVLHRPCLDQLEPKVLWARRVLPVLVLKVRLVPKVRLVLKVLSELKVL